VDTQKEIKKSQTRAYKQEARIQRGKKVDKKKNKC